MPTSCTSFDDKKNREFIKIFDKLGSLDCSYFSYTIERDDGIRKNFFLNNTWLNTYLNEGFIQTCPLTMICRVKGSAFIQWSLLNSLDKAQKTSMNARKDLEMHNGVTISSYVSGTKEMIAMATTKNNHKFGQIILENKEFVQEQILGMRKIAIESNDFECPSSCAI